MCLHNENKWFGTQATRNAKGYAGSKAQKPAKLGLGDAKCSFSLYLITGYSWALKEKSEKDLLLTLGDISVKSEGEHTDFSDPITFEQFLRNFQLVWRTWAQCLQIGVFCDFINDSIEKLKIYS